MIVKDGCGNVLDVDEEYIKYRVLQRDPYMHKILCRADEVIVKGDAIKVINGQQWKELYFHRDILGDYEVYKYMKKQPKELLEYMVKYGI